MQNGEESAIELRLARPIMLSIAPFASPQNSLPRAPASRRLNAQLLPHSGELQTPLLPGCTSHPWQRAMESGTKRRFPMSSRTSLAGGIL